MLVRSLYALAVASVIGLSAPLAVSQEETPAKATPLEPPAILSKRPVLPKSDTNQSTKYRLPSGKVIDKKDLVRKEGPPTLNVPDKVVRPEPTLKPPAFPEAEVRWETITAVLPGESDPSIIPYAIENGIAVLDGDIELGPVNRLADTWALPEPLEEGASGQQATTTRRQGLNALVNTDALWRSGRIPYTATGLPAADQAALDAAVRSLNLKTNLTLVPRTTEADYVAVVIDNTIPGAGRSSLGRQKGRQVLRLKAGRCGSGCITHEFLHAAGFAHEQSRSDRDNYIDILEDNILKKGKGNFKFKKGSQPVGPYDFRSIMHYSATAFGKECEGGATCTTLRAKPSTNYNGRLGGSVLTNTDILGINATYPVTSLASGYDWVDGAIASFVAVGDLNGDGKAEFAVGRRATGRDRLKIYDGGASDNRSIVFSAGVDWGDGAYLTDVAFGDVDGDGLLEIGVTRRSTTNNRYFIYDDLQHGGALLTSGGADWGGSYYATSIAFGDIDNDGRDEFAIGRKAGEHGRYYLFDDARAGAPYKRLHIGGSDWGSGGYTTALAFGDTNGDGRDELGVARKSGTNMRYEVLKWTGTALQQVGSGGADWGDSYYANAIAFGNIDNDPGKEMLVGRVAGENARFFLLDDQAHGFALIDKGGELWGDAYFAVAVDFGDVDGDGDNEIVVARHAKENKRLMVFDYDAATRKIRPLPYNEAFPGTISAMDAATGDIDGDGRDDIIVSNTARKQGQARFQLLLSGKHVN